MKENRIQFNLIVENQLPDYVRVEFPLISEFLSQYYIGQEYQGGPLDLIQNIDEYVKLDNLTKTVESTNLLSDIQESDTTIFVSSTAGFPNTYGLIKIDDEIITYESKTQNSFVNCKRGFSGVSSYNNQNKPEELVFSVTNSSPHLVGSFTDPKKVENLSVLFLKEFLNKVKVQFLPGFESRTLASRTENSNSKFNLNQNLFIKQSKDFYSSKGTDESFKILFNALYGENVEVIKPKEFLFRASDAGYRISNDIVVESISGNPLELENSTLYQDQYGSINKSYSPITKVEKIYPGSGDIEYYKISLDSGYDRDIRVQGAIYGKFSVHPKTKIIGEVSVGQNYLDVDSTIGFPSSGELFVTYPNGETGIIDYKSKSLTQFFECSNISYTIPDKTSVDLNTFAYGYGFDKENPIKVKIRSVLNSLSVKGNPHYYAPDDKIKIRTLGIESKDKVSNIWHVNVSTSYNVKSIRLQSNNTYRVELFDNHFFKIGDIITISSEYGSTIQFEIIDILNKNSFVCEGGQFSTLNSYFTVKRSQLKAKSSIYDIGNISANVQNVYKLNEKTLVASPSIPYYSQQLSPQILSYNITGIFPAGDTIKITSNSDHGFYTGDAIYYTPEKVTSTDSFGFTTETIVSSLFDEGIYYVTRVDDNRIKLSRSNSDIFGNIFVTLSSDKSVSNNKIELLKFKGKKLSSQKLLREISSPINDGKSYETQPGQSGILVNGVEILNYKSTDVVYYGPINEIEVLSGGVDYDVINPPVLSISDHIGVGATGYCSVKGNLKEIRITDPGFDYLDTPTVKITGGNGRDANAFVSLTDTIHTASFISDEKSSYVDLTTNTIGFSTYHKFRNNELVIYKTQSQKGISGLTTNSYYYVSVLDPTTIKLYKTFEDSVSGINTISLNNYGEGTQILESFNKKKVVSSIVIDNQGFDYENKKRTCTAVGINTSTNTIKIKNHDYKSGEILTYNVDGSPVTGLSTSENYYVTVLDPNTFKLSKIGVGLTNERFFYETNQYVNLNSVGVGTHIFNYPEIKVEILGSVGISSVSGEEFKCKIQPIFSGEITSVHLSNNGSGYGSPNILNYLRNPEFDLIRGNGAYLYPIVLDGEIVDVSINDTGEDYNTPPKLIVEGNGEGATLTPIVSNGKIVAVNILNSGRGYSQNLTSIRVVPSGEGAKFAAKIKSWNVNLFQRYLKNINGDDGVIVNAIDDNYGLEYCHLYAPRNLRRILYSLNSSGESLYTKRDLKIVNGEEVSSDDHSPIIGWAYDGNPIYGPYGYITKTGGSIAQMKSGYKLVEKSGRPSFPLGFFVEDYEYSPSNNDDTILDENNGRFCITPDFPNGTYAYFATFNQIVEGSGTFNGYKSPAFPYLIGKNYYSKPNPFNFDKNSNQDEYDLVSNSWLRNSNYYNFTKNNSSYDYLLLPDKLQEHLSKVKSVKTGSVDNIGILTGGFDYKIGDSIVLNLTNNSGEKFSAKVSEIGGKEITSVSVSSTTINHVEFYPIFGEGNFVAFTSSPHSLSNNDLIKISGVSTTSSFIEGSHVVGVNTNNLRLVGIGTTTLGISSTGITGIVTYISVSGNLVFPNIRENDILKIDDEKVKVLNIDALSSRIRILREIDGTTGVSHTASTPIYEQSRKFVVNVGYRTTYTNIKNQEIYFNPQESLGVGTVFGVGIGVTLSISNPGAGKTQIFIPTKSIYLPNHKLETGDEVLYYTNTGTPIGVSTNGITTSYLQNGSVVYIAKITDDLVGISTFKVGLGSTGSFVGITSTTSNKGTLFLTSFGSGTYHSFKTNYPNILTGNISKNLVIVSTAQSHRLINDDQITIDIKPSIASTFSVAYDDYNRRLTLDERSFIASNIDLSNSSIRLQNHGFVTGQEVIHISSSPSTGLETEKIYYVYVLDENYIQLSESLYDSTIKNPKVVNITSASFGNLLPVNPPIIAYKNSPIVFDLTDSSLSHFQNGFRVPSFNFDIFVDENFNNKFERSSKKSNKLNVVKNGIIGVSSDARLTIFVDDEVPNTLYYKLTPTNLDSLPETRKEIVISKDVYQNNTISIKQSLYNGNYKVQVSTAKTFTYNISDYPEKDIYTKDTAVLDYKTTSIFSSGPIRNIKILNKGYNFNILPGVSTVISKNGYNALLESESNTIGRITKFEIENIGFDYPTDFTARPTSKLADILKIEPLSSFKFVGVTSSGYGYSTPPKLIVIDGNTRKQVTDVDLRFNIQSNTVDILKNTKGLFGVPPVIIPTQNSNGVGISSIVYNSLTKDATVFLSVGFTTVTGFPFAVNDKILIENTSIIGSATTYAGYNSENYNYTLFTVKSVTPNYGGFGANIVFNMSQFLSDGQEPGTYDPLNTIGRVIPEKYFPSFYSLLDKNQFLEGEEVTDGISNGIINRWNSITEFATIKTSDDFEIGEILVGKSSGSRGLIRNAIRFGSEYNLDSFSQVKKGWSYDAGFLNDNKQRISDNFYYQNFSYSLKSRVDYDSWKDAVINLNHPAGFRKFSDYQLETTAQNSMVVGIPTSLTDLDIKVDLIGVVDTNCVYNFDVVSENAIELDSKLVSNEIYFDSALLTDYTESIGNRVLVFDDISGQFNSYPRTTKYSIVNRVPSQYSRAQKYIIHTRDKRFYDEKQLTILSILSGNSNTTYMSQYSLSGFGDLGYFDVASDNGESVLEFYPTKFSANDYDITSLSYNLKDSLSSIASTSFGCVSVATSSVLIPKNTTTTLVSIANTYISSKILVEVGTVDGNFEFNELSLVNDGSNVYVTEFGKLNNAYLNNYVGSGLGTYHAYISGSVVNVDFIPYSGISTSYSNTICVSLANTSSTGIGTFNIKHVEIRGSSTSIASSTSPTQNIIETYSEEYDAAYFIVQVSDLTNNRHQMSEVLLIDNETYSDTSLLEFGTVETYSGLGTIGSYKTSSTYLTFTPLPNIDVEVKVYMNALRYEDDSISQTEIDLSNVIIKTGYSQYFGTERDLKREFGLSYKSKPVFLRDFYGNDPQVVSVGEDTITIPDHFFVTGEELEYRCSGIGSTQSIGIALTSIPGFGTTDKLPNTVYAVKINEKTIKLASSAENALKASPITFGFTNVGIGTSHTLVAKNQNNKVLISLDNIIQSPIVSTGITTKLAKQVKTTDDFIYFSGITSFFGGDLIRIGNEILRIEGVGIGSTNSIRVKRSWLGTNYAGYSTGSLVTKVTGNYNIVDNTINFVEAPYGNIPLSSTSNPPDSRDWVGITTRSKFHGRMFMRSGSINGSSETYQKNYIFDDISESFTGIANTFTLKSSQSNVIGFSTGNAIILINDVFQEPGLAYQNKNYYLTEDSGETKITFVGTAKTIGNDIGISSYPRGGIIVSVGSSEGFGYQPLVSAGGTAIVSISGTISSISIGNSGSGYRPIQTVRVGVATSSTGTPDIHYVGIASISNGNIVSVAITNPGIGYTRTNPPYVIFDSPLSYSNIPLIYSNNSVQGIGSFANVNVVVGQGSSIIDFELQSIGYGYGQGEILTLPIGGISGIPTTTQYKPFELTVQKTFNDKFSGWTVGELQVLDNFDSLFNGRRRTFSLRLGGNLISLLSSPGSNIDIQSTLLVFINGILQIPGESYRFKGGSILTFTEAPKEGDTSKIIFYRGSGDIDVAERQVLETVKIGDGLTIGYDPTRGQQTSLQEDERVVTSVDSVDIVSTNPYFGPGNVDDPDLLRPVLWCRQTEDKIINSKIVGKDRELYEALINPSAYIIRNVGIGETFIYVDNIRPFFNPYNETNTGFIDPYAYSFQNSITLISQDNLVSASATATVSPTGTISEITLTGGGVGYGTTSPTISIQSPVGFGITQRATAYTSTNLGIVTSVTIINSGYGYTSSNPPTVLISPPSPKTEKSSVFSFGGDSGVIVGFGTTTISGNAQLIFDLFIPEESLLRDGSIVGIASTSISGISTGDYFITYNTNVGLASTYITSNDIGDNPIGVCSSFFDGIYQVNNFTNVVRNVVGVGTTHVRRIYVKVSGITTVSFASTSLVFGPLGISTNLNYYGNYSWGKIQLVSRNEENTFNAYTLNGISGISTSDYVIRSYPLKSKNYLIP